MNALNTVSTQPYMYLITHVMLNPEHTELVGQAEPLCEVWDVHLTMRLDSLLITFSFQLAAHQQKTEQNVLLI